MGTCYAIDAPTLRQRLCLNKLYQFSLFWCGEAFQNSPDKLIANVRSRWPKDVYGGPEMTVGLLYVRAEYPFRDAFVWRHACELRPSDPVASARALKIGNALYAFCERAQWQVEVLSDTDDEVWHRRVDDEGYEEIEV
jgi:hypothetical protein